MRLWLLSSLVVGAAAATDLPPWLYVVGTVAGSGVFLRYYTAKVEKRIAAATAAATEATAEATAASAEKTSVERQQMLDDMQKVVLHEAEVRMHAMQLRVGELETRIAERDTQIAELRAEIRSKDTRIVVFRHELERLHDEIATTRAEAGLVERRQSITLEDLDPPPDEV